MKILFSSLVLAALLVPSLNAQQKSADTSSGGNLAPTRYEVEKFMEVMQVRQRIQSMREAEREQIKTYSHDLFAKSLPEATEKKKSEYEKFVADELNAIFVDYPVEYALRDAIPIYQSHFTESDLQQIIAFYSSPVGQKVLKEVPAMTAEAARVAYSRIQPGIETMMKDLATRIQAIESEEGNK